MRTFHVVGRFVIFNWRVWLRTGRNGKINQTIVFKIVRLKWNYFCVKSQVCITLFHFTIVCCIMHVTTTTTTNTMLTIFQLFVLELSIQFRQKILPLLMNGHWTIVLYLFVYSAIFISCLLFQKSCAVLEMLSRSMIQRRVLVQGRVLIY